MFSFRSRLLAITMDPIRGQRSWAIITQIIIFVYFTQGRLIRTETCNKRGVFALTDKFYPARLGKIEFKLDVTDFMGYANRLIEELPNFEKEALNHTRYGVLEPKGPTNLIELTKEISVFKIESVALEASQACYEKNGVLANLDRNEYYSALIEIMKKLEINDIPIDIYRRRRLDLTSSNGRYLTALSKDFDKDVILSQIRYFRLTKEGVITTQEDLDTSGTTSTTTEPSGPTTVAAAVRVPVLCMINRPPYDTRIENRKPMARKWIDTVQKFVKTLNRLVGVFKTIKSGIDSLPVSVKESSSYQQIKAYAPMKLIELITFVGSYPGPDVFGKFGNQEVFKIGELLKYAHSLVNLQYDVFSKPSRIQVGNIEPVLSYADIFGPNNTVIDTEAIKLESRASLNDISSIHASLNYFQADEQNDIEIIKVNPFSKYKYSPVEGYIMKEKGKGIFMKEYIKPSMCSETALGKVCKDFKAPVYEERDVNCAKYLLGIMNENNCQSRNKDIPTVVRSNCNGTDSLYSSHYTSYDIDMVCNDADLNMLHIETLHLDAGLSKIDTECKLKTGDLVLAPQTVAMAVGRAAIERIDIIPKFEWISSKMILVIGITVTVIFLSILLNVWLAIKFCCPEYFEKIKCRCCCRRCKRGNEHETRSSSRQSSISRQGSFQRGEVRSSAPPLEYLPNPVFERGREKGRNRRSERDRYLEYNRGRDYEIEMESLRRSLPDMNHSYRQSTRSGSRKK